MLFHEDGTDGHHHCHECLLLAIPFRIQGGLSVPYSALTILRLIPAPSAAESVPSQASSPHRHLMPHIPGRCEWPQTRQVGSAETTLNGASKASGVCRLLIRAPVLYNDPVMCCLSSLDRARLFSVHRVVDRLRPVFQSFAFELSDSTEHLALRPFL